MSAYNEKPEMTPFPFTQAQWVWTADIGDTRWAVRRFRSSFTIDAPQTVTLYVCADSRYTLFCNGERLGRGPARSDVRHQMWDTYSVALPAGTHLPRVTRS